MAGIPDQEFSEPIPDEPIPDEPNEAVEQRSEQADRESLRRALRDLEAAEARVKRNAERLYDETREKLVMQLLPVLDNLDRTIAAAAHSADPVLLEGVQMTRKQLEGVLGKYGVERIDAQGEPFDPTIHEAIATAQVDDPKWHKIVVEQYEPGYRMGERVLRPAKVVVGVYQ